MLKEILIIIAIILSFPVGYLIASWSKDELIVGRKWFKILLIVSAFGIGFFFAFRNYVISYSFMVMFIVSLIAFLKSFDKNWTKKRI